jgi:hypothetical protein
MCKECDRLLEQVYKLNVENAKLKKHNIRLKNANADKVRVIQKLQKRLRLLDPKQLYYNVQKGVKRK